MEGFGPRPAPLTIRAGQSLAPLIVTAVCVMLSTAPFGTVFGFAVIPAFGFAAIFYWTVNRPDIFSVWSVLALGLFQDFLLGDPLGLWTAVYLVIYGVLLSQRALFMGSAAHSPWMGFAVFAALAGLLAWIFASFYYGALVPGGQLAFQMFITTLFYPLIRPIFAIIDKQLRLQPVY